MNPIPYSLQCEAPPPQIYNFGVDASRETLNFVVDYYYFASISLLIDSKSILSRIQSIFNSTNSKECCDNMSVRALGSTPA